MKGYRFPKTEFTSTVEERQVFVGCQRCKNTWYELSLMPKGIGINGPLYMYDCCDRCITEKEKSNVIG